MHIGYCTPSRASPGPLEQQASNDDWRELDELWLLAGQAVEAAKQYLAQMEPVSPAAPPSPSPSLDVAALRTGIEELRQLLVAADMEADELFARLQDAFATLMPDEFALLEESIGTLNYAKATELCTQLLQHIAPVEL